MSSNSIPDCLLGDVVFEQTERAGDNLQSLKVYGVSRQSGITAESKYQSDKLERYKILRHEMFAYNPMRLNIGSIGYCHTEMTEGLVSPDYVVFGCIEDKLNSEYLNYYSKSSFWNTWVKTAGVGSVRTRIYFRELQRMPIKLPSVTDQKRIVTILKSLDKKIDLNRRINRTLEQIAQAIFKSWFIDFDPVKAKQHIRALGGNEEQTERAAQALIAGAVNLNAITNATDLSAVDQQLVEALSKKLAHQVDASRAQLATTASYFPDQLVESELGLIPERWTMQSLGAISRELRRGISPKYVDKGGIAVVNQKCIRDHTIDFSLCKRNDPAKRSVEGRKIQVNDVLINSTGVGTLGRVAPVRHLAEETVVDSHVTVARANTEHISPNYLIQFVLSKESSIEASGAGSTGQTELRKQVLEDIQLCLPPLELQDSLESLASSMNSQYANNEIQIQNLLVLRDTLLPRLLSGELDIAGEKSC